MTEPDPELETITATTTNNGNAKINPETLAEDSLDFTLLRLDSFNSSGKTTSSATTHYHTPCSSCGCSGASFPATNVFSSSNKRRSQYCTAPAILDFQDQIPKKPKKLFLEPQENSTTAVPSLFDFSKNTLPCTVPSFDFGVANSENRSTSPVPVLRRCHSDPSKPPVSGSDSISGIGTSFAANQVPQSPPENAKIAGSTALTTPSSKGTASLPPRPRPPFKRTLSDPSPNKSFSRSWSSNDMPVDGSSQYKWLKRMRDCMMEMSQWWDEVLPDGVMAEEEEDKSAQDNSTDATKADLVTEYEEAVCVERSGDCLIVRFKCPCSKGYQILLSGTDCYYKLL